MQRKRNVLLVLLVLVAAFVVYLAMRNPEPPLLPADADHATYSGAEACLFCHGPDGDHPRSRNHPLGKECLRCHGFR